MCEINGIAILPAFLQAPYHSNKNAKNVVVCAASVRGGRV